MGLFTLFACSDEVVQDVDKQSENPEIPMSVYTNDNLLPGVNIPGYVVTGGYESPYEEPRITGVSYEFINDSHYEIIITPHVGIYGYSTTNEYYDYHYMLNGGFPGLFAGGVKYGNTVALDPIQMAPNNTHITYGPSIATFPINGASWGVNFTDNLTPLDTWDMNALMEVGKIYFIEYTVLDEKGYVVAQGILKQKVGDDTMDINSIPATWQHVEDAQGKYYLSANPDLALIHHDTQEICLVNMPGTTIVPSEVDIYGYTLSFVTDASSVYVICQK